MSILAVKEGDHDSYAIDSIDLIIWWSAFYCPTALEIQIVHLSECHIGADYQAAAVLVKDLSSLDGYCLQMLSIS